MTVPLSCAGVTFVDEGLVMKRCTRCGAIKLLEDFYSAARAHDGCENECKECSRARGKRAEKDNSARGVL
jgi:hypothetical protein